MTFSSKYRGIRCALSSMRVTIPLALALCGALVFMMYMPRSSPTSWMVFSTETDYAERLRQHVEMLAYEIGERNFSVPEGLEKTVNYLEEQLEQLGYEPKRQEFGDSNEFVNVEIEILGSSAAQEIIIVGAHYDTALGTAGANDNGTGVALLLELAALLREFSPERTIRLVFFTNEEPPFFKTDLMGSKVYAHRSKERGERIVCMISLETLGYFSEERGSQRYPFPLGFFYPSIGNFVAVVGNMRSASTVRKIVHTLRDAEVAPIEGGAFPAFLPGISWSDHWAFWQAGYCGVMLTDTAPFRYPYYHTAEDLPSKVDFTKLSGVLELVSHMTKKLVRGGVK